MAVQRGASHQDSATAAATMAFLRGTCNNDNSNNHNHNHNHNNNDNNSNSNKQQATSNPPTPNKEQPTTSNQQRETIRNNHYNNLFFHSSWGEKNTHLQRQRLKLHSAPFPQFQCWSPRNRWPLTGMGVFFTTACPPTPAATLKLGCRGFGHCFVALSGNVCFFHPNRYPSRPFYQNKTCRDRLRTTQRTHNTASAEDWLSLA